MSRKIIGAASWLCRFSTCEVKSSQAAEMEEEHERTLAGGREGAGSTVGTATADTYNHISSCVTRALLRLDNDALALHSKKLDKSISLWYRPVQG